MWKKLIIGLLVIVFGAGLLAWFNRTALLTHLVLNRAAANKMDVAPYQPVTWQQGPAEPGQGQEEQPAIAPEDASHHPSLGARGAVPAAGDGGASGARTHRRRGRQRWIHARHHSQDKACRGRLQAALGDVGQCVKRGHQVKKPFLLLPTVLNVFFSGSNL